MQGVELVFVARLLPKDLLSAFQSDLEGGLQVRLSGDLALNVPDQATKPGAHFAQMAQALLVTTGVEQAAHFTPRMCRETDERLAQLDAMMLRRPVEPLYGAQDQMAVCRVSDGFGLDRGVHGDPLQLALADGFGLDGDSNRLGQKRLKVARSNAAAPARHR